MKQSSNLRNSLAAPVNGVRPENNFIQTPSDNKLFCQYWYPKEERDLKGLVYICHGFGEHMEWYSEIGILLAKSGFLTFGHDLIGHGRSDGSRALISSYETCVNNVFFHIAKVKFEYRELPCFILAHSIGAIIALRAVSRNPSFFAGGMVLQSPLLSKKLSLDCKYKKWHLLLARVLALVLPDFPVARRSPTQLTRDTAMLNRIKVDPLRWGGGYKVGFIISLNDYMQKHMEFNQSIEELSVPFVILHGEDDDLCPLAGSQSFFENSSAFDKKIITYPGAKHNLFIETLDVRREAMADVVSWLLKRCKAITTENDTEKDFF